MGAACFVCILEFPCTQPHRNLHKNTLVCSHGSTDTHTKRAVMMYIKRVTQISTSEQQPFPPTSASRIVLASGMATNLVYPRSHGGHATQNHDMLSRVAQNRISAACFSCLQNDVWYNNTSAPLPIETPTPQEYSTTHSSCLQSTCELRTCVETLSLRAR